MRSLLYVPASRPRMLGKLPSLTADAVAIDFEDGVAPGDKDKARHNLRQVASRILERDGPRWMMRVNPPGSPWHDDDMLLAGELRPPATLLPKAEEAGQVRDIAKRCATWGGKIGLMIETARGVAAVRDLVAAHTEVELLVLGSADLRRSIGARPGAGRGWELLAMQELLLAARAHGCLAMDSVYFHYKDERGLREHAAVARDLGYDGKSCIHPAQVAPIHEVFSSTPDEVAWARAVRRAWDEQDGDSRGVVVHEGEMIEALHLEIAARILDRQN
jgi:citrate lyase subunit beta/citryl-CoA lyase